MQILDLHALLAHRVAVANGNASVLEALMVDGDAERGADSILAAIALAYAVLLLLLAVEVVFEFVHHLLRKFGQAILLDERQHCGLHGSKRRGDTQHHAAFSVLQLLHLIGVAENCEEHAVYADGGLHAVRNITLARLGIEVLQFLSAEFLMVAEVEVGAGVDALEFLEAEGEIELDIGGGVGIVCQLLMVVETVILISHSKGLVPLHAGLFPLLEPLHLGAGLAEEFHLHLLEFAHAEDELAGHHLVAEGLADLRDAEGDLHAAGLLHVDIVHEDALGCLRAEIDGVCALAGGTELGAEHEVELAHIRPVLGAGDRADDAAVQDYLLIFGQVVGVLGSHITVVNLVVVCLFAQHVGVGFAEFSLVEGVSKALAALLDLLVYLLLDLGEIVLDEHVCAIALLGIAVVDEGVVEGGDVPGCHPGAGVHEDGRVYSDNILVQANHRLPPVILDIVLEFHAKLAVIINRSETVVDLAGRENKAVLFAVGNQNLEKFVLCHFFVI